MVAISVCSYGADEPSLCYLSFVETVMGPGTVWWSSGSEKTKMRFNPRDGEEVYIRGSANRRCDWVAKVVEVPRRSPTPGVCEGQGFSEEDLGCSFQHQPTEDHCCVTQIITTNRVHPEDDFCVHFDVSNDIRWRPFAMPTRSHERGVSPRPVFAL